MTSTAGALLTGLPGSALAEVCDKTRPAWVRTDDPATAWDELLALSSLPITLALFALTGIALATRNRASFVISALLWASMAFVIAIDRYENALDDVQYYAIVEGCLGSPHLFIGLAIAICAVMTYGALRPRT
ncbi:hypothetical protein [Phaeobacter porticola]|uniref:hypothetical protein n=1 Tax=Phaeobacter porticola TaxID=1844006 RepID=UPI000AB3778B|nr:hypothetical protein [Phaeobacter porticola]